MKADFWGKNPESAFFNFNPKEKKAMPATPNSASGPTALGYVPPSAEAPPKKQKLVLKAAPPYSPMINMIWPTIKPFVQELADASFGEFTVWDTWLRIFYGPYVLYAGYIVDDIDAYNAGKPYTETFAGYLIILYDKESKGVHIWQAFILPQFRGVELLKEGYSEIEKEFSKMGSPYMSVSASRKDWHDFLRSIGYTETYTVYRKAVR